jgi:NAD(P)-dependent dehydrogenase (short-subunit alcohol dehydrogenase family)
MDKIALITGANTGIGFETAKGLLAQGFHIIMVCRSAGKGEPAKKKLLFLYPGSKIDFYRCDLANFDHVRKTIDLILNKFDHLDVLINNAGYVPEKVEITGEGHEKTFQTCHLGHFMLTIGLLELLKKSTEGRIINVSSMAYSMGKFQRILNPSKKYNKWQVYGDAKLANILFTIGLAKQLEHSGIEAYSLHPGVVKSGFGHNLQGFWRSLISFATPFMISLEEGAKTSIYLATNKEVKGKSGEYFVKCSPCEVKGKEVTMDNANILWNKSLSWVSSSSD